MKVLYWNLGMKASKLGRQVSPEHASILLARPYPLKTTMMIVATSAMMEPSLPKGLRQGKAWMSDSHNSLSGGLTYALYANRAVS